MSLSFLTKFARPLAGVLLASAAASASAGANIESRTAFAASLPATDDDSTDRIIVRLRDKSALNLPGRVKDLEGSAAVPLAFLRTMSGDSHVVRLAARMKVRVARDVARRLAKDPRVLSAEVDHKMYAQRVPNDPMYAQQWNYFEPAGGINMPAAWDVTVGSSSIVVAVIDTGILPHADLAGRVLAGYDFITDPAMANDGDGRDANAVDSGDYGCNGSNSSWHGTHVAGTIGANSNNSFGVAGINWTSKIAPLRVLGKCGGYTSDIVDALRWAAGINIPNVPSNPTPARVANLSLGGANGGCSAAFQSAINDVSARGMVVVVAAGNSAADTATFEPASCDGVIAVAATTRTGGKAPYSNFGPKVSIAAPGGGNGQGVLSTLNSGATVAGADSYAYYEGTSMATPHVTGVVSLMLSVNPSLTPSQIKQRIEATARPFPAGTGADCTVGVCGAGILNAGAALAGLPPPAAPNLPPPPVTSPPAPASTWVRCATEGGTCSFAGTARVRYGANGTYVVQTGTSAIACSNAVFGDPVPGVVKACDYENAAAVAPVPAPAPAPVTTWMACAAEGQTCLLPGTRQVRYGAGGTYAYQTGTSAIACTNAVFGDPVVGTAKTCDYANAPGPVAPQPPAPAPAPAPVPAPAWTSCAPEGGICTFSGTHPVRYGANGVYAVQNAAASIGCNNATFGDPLPGTVKSCEYQSGPAPANLTLNRPAPNASAAPPLTLKSLLRSIYQASK